MGKGIQGEHVRLSKAPLPHGTSSVAFFLPHKTSYLQHHIQGYRVTRFDIMVFGYISYISNYPENYPVDYPADCKIHVITQMITGLPSIYAAKIKTYQIALFEFTNTGIRI